MLNNTSKEILAALTKKYAPPAYGFLREVRGSTGWDRLNTADGLAMGLWRSRGLELIGFEVKSFRSDWLSELKKPDKADTICSFCDRWWIVSVPGVVNKEELPPTWGLMELVGKRLKTIVDAPKLEPKPIDRMFLASMFRDFTEGTVPREVVQKMIDDGVEERMKYEKERMANEIDYDGQQAKMTLKRNLEAIKEFEEASGLEFSNWSMGNIGRAVKIAQSKEDMQYLETRLNRLHDDAKSIVESIGKVLEKE